MEYSAIDFHEHYRGLVPLQGSTFSKFGIEEGNFSDGDFDGGIFEDVKFVGCDFRNSTFKHASFSNCSFDRCNLENAAFESCQASGLYISESAVDGCSFMLSDLETFCAWECEGTMDFETVSMDANSSIMQCRLKGSNFDNADLEGVFIMETDLSEVEFTVQTRLDGVTFMNCDLTDSWAFYTNGGENCEFMECRISPFINGGSEPLHEALPRTDSPGVVYVSSVAHLYCADMEEFKTAK